MNDNSINIMEFGTELMFINEAPSAVPGMLTLLQLDPYLKPYRQEIERRYMHHVCTVVISHHITLHGGDRRRPPKASFSEKYNHNTTYIMRKIL